MYKILESEYAKFDGSKYAVSCNSGTSALHLALIALKIGLGDEVIVPDFTMVACGFSVAYTGAKVVTVDCDETLCIDVDLIEAKITPKTKAIMAVHIYGRLCNMDKIIEIARKHNLYVILDACEAQGAVYQSKADITCYSFYKNKIIHAEEGGMVTTDNKKWADDISDLKNMSFGDCHDYFHKRIGYNYRMADSQAKMALDSLNKYTVNNEKRREFEFMWNKLIPTSTRDAVWVYDFLCYSTQDKQEKIMELTEKKVHWRHFFKPLSSMPMFAQETGLLAWDYSKRGLYICYEN